MASSADHSTTPSTVHEEQQEVIDDWNLEFDFHLFARHELRKIYSHNLKQRRNEAGDCDDASILDLHTRYIQVECVESLTPVDMMNLGAGSHDATGNCVWTGAFLLIEALHLLHEQFDGKRLIELGSGTGIGGIALLRSECAVPSHVVLSDGDPDVLELCRRNCQHNQMSASSAVVQLAWGGPIPQELWQGTEHKDNLFDTVFASDVLYDIAVLESLLQTAAECLGRSSRQRSFVLSHIPRACYSTEHPPVDNLEAYIVVRARAFGFVLDRTIRPAHCSRPDNNMNKPSDALNGDITLEEMEQIGAAVLVFSLESTAFLAAIEEKEG